jgi:hypothetical protein
MRGFEGKPMPDVFVSYATPDREAAYAVAGFLEGRGITCWIAPRNVAPGADYGSAIMEAIGEVKALVLILSEDANSSQYVRREVERAVSRTKPVLPVRIREVTPSGSLEFFVGANQWVDAFKSPLEAQLLPLVQAIGNLAGTAGPGPKATIRPRRRLWPMLVAAGLAAVAAIAVAVWFFMLRAPALVPQFLAGVWCEVGQENHWREVVVTKDGRFTMAYHHPQVGDPLTGTGTISVADESLVLLWDGDGTVEERTQRLLRVDDQTLQPVTSSSDADLANLPFRRCPRP